MSEWCCNGERARYRAHVILRVAVESMHYEQSADRVHMSADSETGVKLHVCLNPVSSSRSLEKDKWYGEDSRVLSIVREWKKPHFCLRSFAYFLTLVFFFFLNPASVQCAWSFHVLSMLRGFHLGTLVPSFSQKVCRLISISKIVHSLWLCVRSCPLVG